jgi:hypothetical protein
LYLILSSHLLLSHFPQTSFVSLSLFSLLFPHSLVGNVIEIKLTLSGDRAIMMMSSNAVTEFVITASSILNGEGLFVGGGGRRDGFQDSTRPSDTGTGYGCTFIFNPIDGIVCANCLYNLISPKDINAVTMPIDEASTTTTTPTTTTTTTTTTTKPDDTTTTSSESEFTDAATSRPRRPEGGGGVRGLSSSSGSATTPTSTSSRNDEKDDDNNNNNERELGFFIDAPIGFIPFLEVNRQCQRIFF